MLTPQSPAGGSSRLDPRWWDHQRHVLVALRRAIEHTLRTRIPVSESATIVDLGSGEAPYAPLFARPGWRYVRCDLDGPVDIRIVPGEQLPLADSSCDGVVSFQVLEHVWDLDWYLGESLRILRPGGFLLLSTHGTWPYHPHPTDYRRWTRDGLERELSSRGFAVQGVEPVVGPLAWTTLIRLLGARELLRRFAVTRWSLLPLLIVLANIKMVVEDAVTPAHIVGDNACVYVTFSQRPVA